MKLNKNYSVFFLSSVFLMAMVSFLFGAEARIFGSTYFATGLRYDTRLDILVISLTALAGILFYRVIKNKAGINFTDGSFFQRHRNKFLILSLVLVSGTNFTGGFKSNYPRVWNTALFGTKADGVTDDTQPIRNTISACVNAGGGKVYFLDGVYIAAGPILTSVTYGSTTLDANCQIDIPWDTAYANTVSIELEGESPASPGNLISSPFSTGVYADMGVTIYSTYTGTRSTTNKGTAIIGSGALTNSFNFNTVNIKNINFKAKNNPNGAGPEIGGFNGKNLIGFNADYCTYYTDTYANNYTLPTREISGFETPETGGGASYRMTNLSANNIKWGYIFGEHVSGDQISAIECYYGYGIKPGGHASTFQRMNAYWCTYGINWYQFGANETSVQVFNIDEFDIEFGVGNTGKYFNTVKTIVDSTNKFQADIHYAVITQNVGLNNASWSMTGGSKVSAIAIGTFPFGYDGISAYDLTTGQLSITKNASGDHGYTFTNASTTGYAHVQLVSSNFQTEIWHNGSATTPYSISLANMSTYYTNSTAGTAVIVDANAPWVLATGTAPATERLRVSGAGLVTPGTTVSQDFGSSSLAWRDIYLSHPVGKSTIGVSSGLGTNVTSVTPAGSDAYFNLTVVTSATATGTIGLVAFGRTWGATPYCVVSAANSATGAMIASAGGYVALNATSTTSMTLAGLFTGAGTWVFNCHCGQ